jgi:hypothetical protein
MALETGFFSEKLNSKPWFSERSFDTPFINLLLCVPGGQSPHQYAFNPLAILQKQSEWRQRHLWVLRPYIFAPEWNDDELGSLLNYGVPGTRSMMGSKVNPREVREKSFTDPAKSCEIIHLSGVVNMVPDQLGTITYGQNGASDPFYIFLKRFQQLKTRLLIIETSSEDNLLNNTLNFAEGLAGHNGPSVLVVSGAQRSEINTYLTHVYLRLLENVPLPELIKPRFTRKLEVLGHLFYGQGVEDSLRLPPPIAWSPAKEEETPEKGSINTGKPGGRDKGETRGDEEITSDANEAFEEPPIYPYTEAKGADEPKPELSPPTVPYKPNISHAKPPLIPPELPARFLNANFAEEISSHFIRLDESLVAGRIYELLVDIGPLWTKDTSLLGNSAAFPETAVLNLLTEEDRNRDEYQVQVVFASQDFSPTIASAILCVPRDERMASNRVRLKVKAPNFPIDIRSLTFIAHGRLCLYYKNNLLQSAIVNASIARTKEIKAPKNNFASVDFILSGNFASVESAFGERDIKIGEGDDATTRPVNINLTLNEDGSGQHRLLVKHSLETQENYTIPPAWKPYDPGAAQKAIIEFRKVLDFSSDLTRLNKYDNFRDKFKDDLKAFAVLGDRLRAEAFGNINPGDDNLSGAEWQYEFFLALARGSVIQLARTGSVPLTYVFPWAVIYEYPLEGDPKDFTICRVVDEEWDEIDATRKMPPALVCPHADEHGENVVCPYGFWGFKHIIEQPISYLTKAGDVFELKDKVDTIITSLPTNLSLVLTDRLNDLTGRNRHLADLGKIGGVFPLPPARDREAARKLLRAPQLVYFLCHGEKDNNGNTYLSIGDGTDPVRHRITPDLFDKWIMPPPYLDIKAWKNSHPLIFINGCHTADLIPELTLNFVSAFSHLRAGGVIGTEISVLAGYAYEAGQSLLMRLARGEQVGQAVRGMRWDMLNAGSFVGLAYTPYCLAELHLAPQQSG